MNHSKGFVYCVLTFLVLAALALPGSLRAQGNFVYTNDDIWGANTVSGFSVASNGALTKLPGSPFSTLGTGAGGGLYASNRITVSAGGNFLFAANTWSKNVSVFSINRRTGTLTLVAGSPFATHGSGGSGIALSATPDGKFLMAANNGSNNITVFTIASSGALTPIPGSPFPALSDPEGIKVSPNGKFLAVAEPDYPNHVEMFEIAPDGSLTSLGAFPGKGTGELTGVDINCASRLLYGGEYTYPGAGTIVDGYFIGHQGALTPLPGSPFEPGVGLGSAVALLDYRMGGKTLFVSNQASRTITVFSVASDGSLSLVPGSPFPMKSIPNPPAGMATSQDGRLLYVASPNKISVFSAGKGGALTEVAGSPFPTLRPGWLYSLTAFPPNATSLLAALLDGCPINAHSGLSSPEE